VTRFVIQQHDRQGEGTHWDLMLEQGRVLKTFRLNRPPGNLLKGPASATPIADHPLRFLTYQGPVNKGQGSVRIVDQGTYSTLAQSDQLWDMEWTGTMLTGRFRLCRDPQDRWELARA
jgi:hypothetical protein